MQMQPARMQLVYVSRHEAGSASVVPCPVCAYETVTVSRKNEGHYEQVPGCPPEMHPRLDGGLN